MTSDSTPWRNELVVWLAISAVTTIAFYVGVGLSGAIVAGVWMFGLIAVLHLGRSRSDAIRAIGGAGDERDRDLYTRSLATAGAVTGLLITGWWLATVAMGDPDQTLFVLVIVFSGSFFAAAAYHARRG